MSEVEKAKQKYAFEMDDDAGMYPVIDCHKKQVVVVCDGEEHARHVCKLLNDERAETIASDKLEWRNKHDIMVHRKNEAERMLLEQTAKFRELAVKWRRCGSFAYAKDLDRVIDGREAIETTKP